MKEGVYKYVPELFIGDFRGKVLGEIRIEGDVIGKFVGINTRKIDFKDEKNLDKYIYNILKLKETWDLIYMEDFNLYLYENIESRLNLRFPKGRNIRLYNVVMVLNETLKYKKDIYEKEVLIICEENDLAYEIIKLVSYVFRFISLVGIDKDNLEDLHDRIFEDIGISIFQPEDIKKTLKNTGIIINFSEKIDEDLMAELRMPNKDTIIIDFSIKKPLLEFEDMDIITDLLFDMGENITCENPFIDKEISSIEYESLFKNRIERFNKVCINESVFLNYNQSNKTKLKGRL